ncbi:hypothetical protein N9L68_04465 [bacterium]|nr:hypothetical protein [bacterium]
MESDREIIVSNDTCRVERLEEADSSGYRADSRGWRADSRGWRKLMRDREIVLAAMTLSGWALQCTSKLLLQ